MECILADEAIDTGENAIDVWDLEMLVSLFGEIDTSDYGIDNQLDFAAASQEPPSSATD
jgi:hypothetical protein